MSFHETPLHERLLTARRGTSYLAQRLAELSDSDLDADTLLPGWTRRHLLAHIGYNAAALCRLMDWATTGQESPMYAGTEQRGREIAEGATLTPAALRNLFDHTVARLDEKWRNAPESAWSAEVRTAQGRTVPAAETVWMRTREVWIHAVDLDNGGRFGDFPDTVSESLITDIVGMWQKKSTGAGIVVDVTERAPLVVDSAAAMRTTVRGTLPAVVRWASGRGADGVDIEGVAAQPPRWL